MDIPKTPETRHHPIRALSPLRSPTLAHHFDPFVFNTRWPEHLHSDDSPTYKKMLICKDGYFRAVIDVHDFEKDEVSVKVSGNYTFNIFSNKEKNILLKFLGHTIHVDCSHDERADSYSTVARKLNRTYVLPPTYDMSLVESSIDWSTGTLKINVPPPKKDSVERVIEIKHEETTPRANK
jgi:hypothetical protein